MDARMLTSWKRCIAWSQRPIVNVINTVLSAVMLRVQEDMGVFSEGSDGLFGISF